MADAFAVRAGYKHTRAFSARTVIRLRMGRNVFAKSSCWPWYTYYSSTTIISNNNREMVEGGAPVLLKAGRRKAPHSARQDKRPFAVPYYARVPIIPPVRQPSTEQPPSTKDPVTHAQPMYGIIRVSLLIIAS